MKASKKYLSIVAVAVIALALLCVNGCKKSEDAPETQSGTVTATSAVR